MNDLFLEAIDLHRRGDIIGARAAAQRAIALEPSDIDALHFLGMLESAAGRSEAARDALTRAVAVNPSGPQLTSLARVLAAIDPSSLAAQSYDAPDGSPGDEYVHRRAAARSAMGDVAGSAADLVALASRRPNDREALLAAARALAEAGDTCESEKRYRALLHLEPADGQALLGLVGLLEALGRGGELAALLGTAPQTADARFHALGEVFAARTARRFDEAMSALERAQGLLPPGTEQQLRGELADRAGHAGIAIAAFTAMNANDAAATPEWTEGVQRYRAMVAESQQQLDRGLPAKAGRNGRDPPLFLLGFPRSGTTLLDTFLMGHRAIEVHEERPFLDTAALHSGDATAARDAYWRALDAERKKPDALQLDKYPLAMARAPLLNAMFPAARYLFMIRDPRDVVLSCFMTRFRLNWGVASFLDIGEAARTYEAVMSLWMRSRERLALDVHEVRYENLIAETSDVLKGVANFAEVAFDQAMLDHQATAHGRGMIATPSNAQVIQPLYQRASGRWRRYRELLDPLRPLLDPWCATFGYDVEDQPPSGT